MKGKQKGAKCMNMGARCHTTSTECHQSGAKKLGNGPEMYLVLT